MTQNLIIYCPDCRGKFTIFKDDSIEDDVIECDLCGAEMVVVQEDPLRLKLYTEEDD